MRVRLLLIGSILLFAASAPHADEINLVDGSRLVGTLQDLKGGNLLFKTAFAGVVSVSSTQVLSLTTEAEWEVKPATGEARIGQFAGHEGAQVLVEETGMTPVVWTEVASIGVPGAPPPPPPSVWSGSAGLGIAGQSGNSEQFGINGFVEAKRTGEIWRLMLYSRGNYSEEESVRSANEFLFGTQAERDFTERFFSYGRLELELDEFEDIDYRVTATAGVGYFFIREKKHELKGRAGVGYQHEEFRSGGSHGDAVLELGYDYMINPVDWFKFTHSLTYYPAIDDPIEDFRLLVDTAGEVPLGAGATWKMRFGLRNEYDSEPQDDVEKLDNFYYLNLAYDWK